MNIKLFAILILSTSFTFLSFANPEWNERTRKMYKELEKAPDPALKGKAVAAAKAYFAAIAACNFKLAKKYAADDILKETITMEKDFANYSKEEKKDFFQTMKSLQVGKEYWLPDIKEGAFVAVTYKTTYGEHTRYFGVKNFKGTWKVVGYVKINI